MQHVTSLLSSKTVCHLLHCWSHHPSLPPEPLRQDTIVMTWLRYVYCRNIELSHDVSVCVSDHPFIYNFYWLIYYTWFSTYSYHIFILISTYILRCTVVVLLEHLYPRALFLFSTYTDSDKYVHIRQHLSLANPAPRILSHFSVGLASPGTIFRLVQEDKICKLPDLCQAVAVRFTGTSRKDPISNFYPYLLTLVITSNSSSV
jgi:hypothetical protein